MSASEQPRAIELVWFPGTCSRVTLIALEEIGDPYETRTSRCGARPSVRRPLDHEEASYAELIASGTLPTELPPDQVGRTPTMP